jgi:hypothetical protein
VGKRLSEEEFLAAFSRDDDSAGVKQRITSLVRRLKEAESALEQAETGHSAALESARADARKAADDEWGAKMAARDEDLGLSRLGIVDEDAIVLLRRDHGRLPEQGRPPLVDYARRLQTDPEARKDKSPSLLAGIIKGQGQIPDTGAGTSKSGPLDENAVRAYFARGADGVKEMMSKIGS